MAFSRSSTVGLTLPSLASPGGGHQLLGKLCVAFHGLFWNGQLLLNGGVDPKLEAARNTCALFLEMWNKGRYSRTVPVSIPLACQCDLLDTIAPRPCAYKAQQTWQKGYGIGKAAKLRLLTSRVPPAGFLKQTHCKALVPLLLGQLLQDQGKNQALGVIPSQVSPARIQDIGACWTTSSTQAVR